MGRRSAETLSEPVIRGAARPKNIPSLVRSTPEWVCRWPQESGGREGMEHFDRQNSDVPRLQQRSCVVSAQSPGSPSIGETAFVCRAAYTASAATVSTMPTVPVTCAEPRATAGGLAPASSSPETCSAGQSSRRQCDAAIAHAGHQDRALRSVVCRSRPACGVRPRLTSLPAG
jgi:hypothetical protein